MCKTIIKHSIVAGILVLYRIFVWDEIKNLKEFYNRLRNGFSTCPPDFSAIYKLFTEGMSSDATTHSGDDNPIT